MKQKLILSTILMILLAIPRVAVAFDFSAVAPSGQTLYFNIVGRNAHVTYPFFSSGDHYFGYTKPTGSLTIPSSVSYGGNTYPVTSIGYNAFDSCSGLTSVTIPNSVTTIEAGAFRHCNGLTSISIPNSVTSIEWAAFSRCSGLTSISIPNSVISIEHGAFAECSGLTSIIVSGGNSSYDSRNNCNAIIHTATNTIIVGCQNTIIPNSVISIGDGAFLGCSGLTSITIPNSITSIGTDSFSGCSGLISISIPNHVTSIGNRAFSDCSSLTTVYFNADSCIQVLTPVFDSCTILSTIYFGNNVKTIPSYLCYGLTGIHSITIPNSVTSIGYKAFQGCSGLTSVTIPNSVRYIGGYAFSGCSGLTTVYFNADSCIQVCNQDRLDVAFDNCINLSTFVFGNNVITIPPYLCYGLTGLSSITIPNSVTTIGHFSFQGCRELSSITIPNSVKLIGSYAFSDCSGLTTVFFNADNCIKAGEGNDNIVNPVFYNCTNLSTFNFGNNVTSIPSFLCYDLRGIATVNIPDSVTKIGDYAFSNCRGLTSVSIGNSVTNIGNYAFSNCRWLTSVTIPNFVTSIGKGAFKGCSGLTTVYFNAECCVKAGYASSGNGFPVFGNCTNFSTIKFGNNVTSIPSHLCYGCVGLTDIEIPDSIITVGTAAFKECDHLTNIILGTGLSTIEDFAFYGCIQMVRIKSKLSSPPTVYANTFLGLNDDVILNVPCDAANEYENAAYWFRFNIQEDIMYDFYATSSNPARGTVTIITEPTCDYREAQVQANAYHGYHFDHWSDGNTDNPRYIVVLQDTHIVAYFASDNGEDEGIEETEEEKVKLYQRNGQIVVEGAEGYTVCLYDVVGRLLATRRESAQEVLLDVPASGAYLVKIGDAPARRIVVRR